MNTTFASPAEKSATGSDASRVLVWDAPVRLFHWLMVFSFAGAYLTAESEHWRLVHVTLGYTMAGLVGFRIVWGLVGTHHARFANFVRGPAAVLRYLSSIGRGQPEHFAGHNPAGALAILALLGLTLAVAGSGWGVFNDMGGEWFEEAHEVVANLMLVVVGVHVLGVVISSRLHRENLVGAMVTGYKSGQAGESIRRTWAAVAVVMLIAVAGFWWLQWNSAPSGADMADTPAASMGDKARNHDRDDD